MEMLEFVNGLSCSQLRELGAALATESLTRLSCVMEGLNANHDNQQRGEVFNDPYTAFHLSKCTEALAQRAHPLERQMM